MLLPDKYTKTEDIFYYRNVSLLMKHYLHLTRLYKYQPNHCSLKLAIQIS